MNGLDITLLVSMLLLLSLIAGFTLKNGIGPTPSCRHTPQALDNLLPNAINGTILELGCGWGGMALYLARKYPDNPVIAWENSPIPWMVAYIRQLLFFQDNLKVRYGDIHGATLDDCGLVYCYLCTGQMLRLKKRLVHASISQPCLLVTSTFSVPGWTPVADCRLGDWYGSRIWVYMLSHQTSSSSVFNRLSSK